MITSDAGAVGESTTAIDLDLAEAGRALAGAFREADALFDLAAVHNPGVAGPHAQRLRAALLLLMLVLGEARRESRRRARSGGAAPI